jgi:hypothetical protein
VRNCSVSQETDQSCDALILSIGRTGVHTIIVKCSKNKLQINVFKILINKGLIWLIVFTSNG